MKAITLTHEQVVGIVSGINEIKEASPKLTMDVWLSLNKINKVLKPIKDLIEATQKDLVQKYGKRDKKKQLVTDGKGGVWLEKSEEFTKENNALMAKEVSVEYDMIPLTKIGKDFVMEGGANIFILFDYVFET